MADHDTHDHTGVPGVGGSAATDTIWDAKGDLVAGTGADAAAKLTVGANDLVLTAASGETTGLKWQAPLPAKAQAGMSGNTTTAADTIIDAAGCSISLDAGNWLVFGAMSFDAGTAVYTIAVITDNSNTQVSMGRGIRNTGTPTTLPIPPVIVSPGSTTTYKLRGQTGAAGTILRYGTASVPGTTIAAIRVA